MKNNLIQLVSAIGVLVLAFFVLNPFHVFMPTMFAMLLLAALFVVFCAYAVFVSREAARDEREAEHRSLSGRIAFLIGAFLLMVGIVAEDLAHVLDPWLVIVLIGMIVAKSVVRIWAEMNR